MSTHFSQNRSSRNRIARVNARRCATYWQKRKKPSTAICSSRGWSKTMSSKMNGEEESEPQHRKNRRHGSLCSKIRKIFKFVNSVTLGSRLKLRYFYQFPTLNKHMEISAYNEMTFTRLLWVSCINWKSSSRKWRSYGSYHLSAGAESKYAFLSFLS